jgi:predicted dinucleotide-binding enzyme
MAAQPRLRIGIIGAGNIGGTLTRRLAALGHDVVVANSRGPETIAGLAHETGAKAVTVEEAARDRDVVVVTIPQKNIPDLAGRIVRRCPRQHGRRRHRELLPAPA